MTSPLITNDKIPLEDLVNKPPGASFWVPTSVGKVKLTVSKWAKRTIEIKSCWACGLRVEFGAPAINIRANATTGKISARMVLFGIRAGMPVPFTKDHFVPASIGGHSDEYNIQPLCSDCNNMKADCQSSIPAMWVLRHYLNLTSSLARHYQNIAEANDSEIKAVHERRALAKEFKLVNLKRKAKILYNLEV